MAHSIFMAVPYIRGIEGDCTFAIARTISDLAANDTPVEYFDMCAANIAEQRDCLAHKFLASKHTHMLFVDSDMLPAATLARKLLSFDLPFLGTIYTQRKISIAKIIEAAKAGKPNPEAYGYRWNVWHREDRRVEIDADGLCRVNGIGFGFVLLRRDCLERVMAVAPLYRPGLIDQDVRGFFRPIGTLHEDYSFCERWREVGGEVTAYARADIKHIGAFNFGIPFAESAKAGAL